MAHLWGPCGGWTCLLYCTSNEMGGQTGQLTAPFLKPPARCQSQRALSLACEVGQVLEQLLQVLAVASVDFESGWSNAEALRSAIMSILLTRSSACRRAHCVARCQWMPNREIDQESALSPDAPSLYVQLRGWVAPCCKLGNDLLTSRLVASLG